MNSRYVDPPLDPRCCRTFEGQCEFACLGILHLDTEIPVVVPRDGAYRVCVVVETPKPGRAWAIGGGARLLMVADHCLDTGCAEWAASSVVAFADRVCDELEITPNYRRVAAKRVVSVEVV